MWCSRLMLAVMAAMLLTGLGPSAPSQAQIPLPVRAENPAQAALPSGRFVRVHGDQLDTSKNLLS